jgi:hypothetical protein
MDEPLQKLLAALEAQINQLMGALASGALSAEEWAERFSSELATYHQAALLAAGQPLNDAAAAWLARNVGTQLQFLHDFQLVVQDADEYQAGWRARAQMYGDAIGASYEAGRTRMLPLPALPRDGTTLCLTNCKCVLDIQWIDEAKGDADVYWRMSAGESCSTCKARARLWAPLRFRDGRVV